MKNDEPAGCGRTSTAWFLSISAAALFLIGCGYVFFVPLFEGFDESGHYSSLRQISQTGEIPMRGNAFLERSVAEYQGPTAYGSGEPPFDDKLTYKKFFAAPAAVQDYAALYRTPRAPSNYEPSGFSNWQAQHPPLYYLALSPLDSALQRLAFVDRFLALRIASLAIAVAGVLLGMLAATKAAENETSRLGALLGFAIYPIAFPMLVPEFARLGNDSLCLFFVGLLAYLFASAQPTELGPKKSLLIGTSLGLGLLTKAFFLPIAAGIFTFLFVRALATKAKPELLRARLLELLWISVAALAIGSGWYLYQYLRFGSLSGSDESIQLADQGGLLLGLGKNFSFFRLAKGISATIATFIWAGTWSLTRLPDLFLVPLMALLAVVAVSAFNASRGKSLLSMSSLPAWVLAFFALGLLWHIFVSIARAGIGATPGWYLHIFMPWLAPWLGIGFYSLWRSRLKPLLLVLIVYAVVYQLVAVWAYLTLYSGYAIKGDDKLFHFSEPFMGLFQAGKVFDHLSVLTYPKLGAALFACGLALQLGLIVALMRSKRERPPVTT
ncbi:MAG: hypothetical protein K8U03_02450 [Planctomycetia bacterium]|nr:hypothetical protein [Planctomycetia bacterium]